MDRTERGSRGKTGEVFRQGEGAGGRAGGKGRGGRQAGREEREGRQGGREGRETDREAGRAGRQAGRQGKLCSWGSGLGEGECLHSARPHVDPMCCSEMQAHLPVRSKEGKKLREGKEEGKKKRKTHTHTGQWPTIPIEISPSRAGCSPEAGGFALETAPAAIFGM